MFNSQHVNNDPEPYIVDCGIILGLFRQADEVPDVEDFFDVTYVPRPEYDNNPNPILESFREQSDWGNTNTLGKYENCAEWLWWLSDPTHNVYKWQKLEHIDHARKVLTRLVNVYGGQNDKD